MILTTNKKTPVVAAYILVAVIGLVSIYQSAGLNELVEIIGVVVYMPVSAAIIALVIGFIFKFVFKLNKRFIFFLIVFSLLWQTGLLVEEISYGLFFHHHQQVRNEQAVEQEIAGKNQVGLGGSYVLYYDGRSNDNILGLNFDYHGNRTIYFSDIEQKFIDWLPSQSFPGKLYQIARDIKDNQFVLTAYYIQPASVDTTKYLYSADAKLLYDGSKFTFQQIAADWRDLGTATGRQETIDGPNKQKITVEVLDLTLKYNQPNNIGGDASLSVHGPGSACTKEQYLDIPLPGAGIAISNQQAGHFIYSCENKNYYFSSWVDSSSVDNQTKKIRVVEYQKDL